jgi:predicted Zn-dependent protease
MMNVVFDPTVAHEMASYKFDEVGNLAEKKYLIQNGVLLAALGSLESQARTKISGVANSRSSSWNRAPIDRMANINLEGGDLTLDQMISNVENGIIMFANRSWSIDDYRRKFQFGCEYAKEIKNGKLGKTFKNPNYRGVTVPFWNSLSGLTNNDSIETYGSPYCGKGEPSQVIRVGHSSPYALFKNVEVFGG